MKIKKGDKVIVISGGSKGQTGVVSRAIPSDETVIIEGVNMKTGVQQIGKEKKLGQKAYPLHVSKVAYLDPKTNKPTRIGYEMVAGTKVRVAKKSGTKLDK